MQVIRRLTPEQSGSIPALALNGLRGRGQRPAGAVGGLSAHLAMPVQPLTLGLAVEELARGIRTS
jgi:hypothetical protein